MFESKKKLLNTYLLKVNSESLVHQGTKKSEEDGRRGRRGWSGEGKLKSTTQIRHHLLTSTPFSCHSEPEKDGRGGQGRRRAEWLDKI